MARQYSLFSKPNSNFQGPFPVLTHTNRHILVVPPPISLPIAPLTPFLLIPQPQVHLTWPIAIYITILLYTHPGHHCIQNWYTFVLQQLNGSYLQHCMPIHRRTFV